MLYRNLYEPPSRPRTTAHGALCALHIRRHDLLARRIRDALGRIWERTYADNDDLARLVWNRTALRQGSGGDHRGRVREITHPADGRSPRPQPFHDPIPSGDAPSTLPFPRPGSSVMTDPGFRIPGEVDPRTPLFFLSYAHSLEAKGRARNRRFIKFFEDLSENVAELVARPAGSDPGYMDRSIPDGGRWTAELLTAIGTCQIFVALLSSPYFSSEWCAWEWHAFAQRRARSRLPGTSHQTGIIPVIWAPIRDREIPTAVSAVQRFNPRGVPDTDVAARYRDEGVVGLLQLKDIVAYQAVVWRLAQRIAEVHDTHYVESRTFQVDELRNIFKEQAV
jgi:TIR domain